MKHYIVTADIHVTIKKDINEQWQLKRYELLFTTLVEACLLGKADLIITGDLFDKAAPTLQEQDIVFEFFNNLKNNNITTYLVGGNHETVSKGKDTYSYLRFMLPSNVMYMSGRVIRLKEYNTELHFLSHCNLPTTDLEGYADHMEEYIDDCGVDWHILFTHFRTTVGEYVKEEIDTKTLCKPYNLVVAGDIHSQFRSGELMYTNQPINTAFSATADTSFLNLFFGEDGPYHYYTKTKLPSLIQWQREAVNFNDVCKEIEEHFQNNIEEMGATDFIKVNLTGTLKELRLIKHESPYVKINKIPMMDTTTVTEDTFKSSLEAMTTDIQLVEYLKTLPYTKDNIESLLEIWKEVT